MALVQELTPEMANRIVNLPRADKHNTEAAEFDSWNTDHVIDFCTIHELMRQGGAYAEVPPSAEAFSFLAQSYFTLAYAFLRKIGELPPAREVPEIDSPISESHDAT